MTTTPTPEPRRLAVTVFFTLTDDAPQEDGDFAEAVMNHLAAMPADCPLDPMVDSVDDYDWGTPL